MNNPRNIKYIVVHCTATPTNTTLESIKRYWKEQRGWGDTLELLNFKQAA